MVLPSAYGPSFTTRVTVSNGPVNVSLIAPRWKYDAIVQGEVVDENGVGISNLPLSAKSGFTVPTTADTNGHFALSLPAGTWRIYSGDATVAMPSISLNLVPGVTNLQLPGRRLNALLPVRFRSPEEFTISNVYYSAKTWIGSNAYSLSGSTNREFSMPLFPGDWFVNVYPSGSRDLPGRFLKIVAGENPEIVIEPKSPAPTATISGKIVTESGESTGGDNVAITPEINYRWGPIFLEFRRVFSNASLR